MNTNVNLPAALGVLAFLGTGLLIALAGLVLLYSIITRRFGLARVVLAAIVIVAGVYFGVMLIFSFASSETVLARGAEKHFCEIDCHLAYSVAEIIQLKTLGNPPNETIAQGTYYVVTIRTRFDENTISPGRGNAVLWPNSRVVTVIDEQGQRYAPSPEGQAAFGRSENPGTPLITPLRPGDSYSTNFVFDLPEHVKHPTLLINESEWITCFVIGHENSPFHKKTRFQLDAASG